MNNRRLARWGSLLALWTLLGVLFAHQTYIGSAYGGSPMTWAQSFVVAMTAWYVRALFAPVAFVLARRFPLIQRPGVAARPDGEHTRQPRRLWRPRSLAVHVPAGLLLAAAQQMLFAEILKHVDRVPRSALSPVEVHMHLLTYWAVVAATHALDWYNRYRDREVVTSRLEAQLAGARLDLLRVQLQPHFLFNTLHAISELMHEDVERADLMLTHLSELLRLALASTAAREVPLRQELEFLQRYLEIQQMRFQDRLSVRLDVESEVLDARLPYLILQPLVENAIRHGVATRPGPGRVEVRAARVANTLAGPTPGRGRDDHGSEIRMGMLRLEVRDDGPGLPGAGDVREGLGLANTRLRLQESYGDRQRFELANATDGGLRVTVEIPLQLGGASREN
jgi:two-component system, LytTR family, sensor kinase